MQYRPSVLHDGCISVYIINYLLYCSTPPVQYSLHFCIILWLILIIYEAIKSSKPNQASSRASHLPWGKNNMGNFTMSGLFRVSLSSLPLSSLIVKPKSQTLCPQNPRPSTNSVQISSRTQLAQNRLGLTLKSQGPWDSNHPLGLTLLTSGLVWPLFHKHKETSKFWLSQTLI